MKCAICDEKECYNSKDCTGLRECVEKLFIPEVIKSMKVSARIEAEHYMKKTRLEELILYCKEMGYKRLGIAFCVGLAGEARIVHDILSREFEVHSACCKICGIEKSTLDLDRLHPDKEVDTTCNPIGQALVLNQDETDLNIILGLFIGHDILFTEHSAAPVTTLAVKDRVLAHNPLGAIYSKYYLENVFHVDKGDE